jgi:hypothetical protein
MDVGSSIDTRYDATRRHIDVGNSMDTGYDATR